ncbi:MAG TPA: hypothetical protein VFE78_28525 [Gemmataceae bacterium]|nr:hypothetical protein [Gemmataceae bacterium]
MPRRASCLALLAACLLAAPLSAQPPKKDKKGVNDKIKEVAGTAEFLRSVPKHFATLKAVDVPRRRVTLLIEGEKLAKVWPLAPDAELKVSGWWGRLDQFTAGDRVWAWFQTDRKKQPVAVAMLADEPSEQDIHGAGLSLVRRSADGITVKPAKGAERTLKAKAVEGLAEGKPVYFQSSGETARLVLTAAAFEEKRAAQKAALRKRWVGEGLPGTVTFLHRFSGEMELMLDHEAMRWGRALKLGDKVSLDADPPIPAVVKLVTPWRERTQLRLVVNSFDQTELELGQRVRLHVSVPPPELDAAQLPPNLDRPRAKAERVEWFLASIYCTCKVKGDVCTGHFYTLASCNPNGCGMPNHVRKVIAAKIDAGLTDRQIFEQLLKEQGPELLRPHLLP